MLQNIAIFWKCHTKCEKNSKLNFEKCIILGAGHAQQKISLYQSLVVRDPLHKFVGCET